VEELLAAGKLANIIGHVITPRRRTRAGARGRDRHAQKGDPFPGYSLPGERVPLSVRVTLLPPY
jgi:hypothetical protein